MSFSIAGWEVFLCVFSALLICYLPRSSKMPLPPGPAGALPVIGHLMVMPQSKEWLTYQRWSKELGSDVLSLKVLGKHIIVINSLKAATDLFDGRVNIYSDRPKLYALRELLEMHWIHGLMPYGKSFLKVRKAANKYLHSEPVKEYRHLQLLSVRECLRDLLHSPDSFAQNFRDMAGRIILGVAYGLEAQAGDSYMQNVYMAVQGLILGLSPRALLYDWFPLLKWLPDWLRVKRDAQKYTAHIAALPEVPLQATRAAMENGSAPNSLAASMIADSNLTDDVIRSVTGSMYLGTLLQSTAPLGLIPDR